MTLDNETVFPLAPIPIPAGVDGQICLFVSVKSGAVSTVTVVVLDTAGPQPDTVRVYVVVEEGEAVGIEQSVQDKFEVGDQE